MRNKMKDGVHRDWMVALVLIVIIICGTLIWINHNSWTVRFEMDDNTLKAIESIDWDSIREGVWNNGEGNEMSEKDVDLNGGRQNEVV